MLILTQQVWGTATASDHLLTLQPHEVRRVFASVNIRKAGGLEGIPGRVIRDSAYQLGGPFTAILILSLCQSIILSCFKSTTIIPVPKCITISCLNDYRPVALTLIVLRDWF